jgi:hypothetical protein
MSIARVENEDVGRPNREGDLAQADMEGVRPSLDSLLIRTGRDRTRFRSPGDPSSLGQHGDRLFRLP